MTGSLVVRNGAVGLQGDPFPRLCGVLNGNGSASLVSPAANLTKVANCDFIMISLWAGQKDPVTGQTMAQVCAALKAAGVKRIFAYHNIDELNKSQITGANSVIYDVGIYANTNKQFLYANGLTQTTPIDSWFQQSGANGTNPYAKMNYTLNGPKVAGKNWAQWITDRNIGVYYLGTSSAGGPSLTYANIANPYLDGLFTDDVFWRENPNSGNGSGFAGDYNVDGAVDNNNLTGSSIEGETYNLLSWRAHFDYVRSAWPGSMQIANATWGQFNYQLYGLMTIPPTNPIYGSVEGTMVENLIGKSYSVETFASFKAMMAFYRGNLSACRAPFLCMVGHVAAATDYKTQRYALTATLMDNGYAFISADGGYSVASMQIMDEYSFNLGARVGNVPATAYASYSAADYSGLWMSEFTNGYALCGARRGSGAVGSFDQTTPYTCTLPVDTWRLRGTQDPVTNNAAKINAGSTISISPRDGLILSKTPT